MEYSKDLSIIVPLFNEVESLPELLAWIRSVMNAKGYSYEVIFVDDGSTDGSWDKILELSEGDERVKGISFRRNYGKSAALYHGFAKAEGRVVVTMDADLQDSPEEIPEMYRMVVEDGYDVVSGWKQHRQDNKVTKNLPSKLYNATARKITGIKLHDMNCGLKAYKNEVHHQKRKYGKSKFGIERFVNGFLDLLSLWFLSTFGKKPMHFFGFSGLLMFLIGFVMTIWIIIAKLVHQAQGIRYRAVTDQPLFYLALVAIVLGVILFLAGFIGEMVSRNSQERNKYNVKDQIR